MDPANLLIPINTPVIGKDGKMVPVWWDYFVNVATGLSTIDLSSQVTGVLPFPNGGTSKDDLQFTTSAATNLTLPTSGTVVVTTSPITAVNLTVTSGVTANAGGIKHGRVTTGSINAGVSALVTLTWGTAFADANYTAVASVVNSTAATASLSVVHIETQLAASVSVRVANTAAGALTGTLQVIAFHD